MIFDDDPIVMKPCVLYAITEDKQHRILSDLTVYKRERSDWVKEYDPDPEIIRDYLIYGKSLLPSV
jgi:hypothetical protein